MALVETQHKGAVGWITLNRPEVMNAISVELGRELVDALDRLSASSRVIAIRGAGGNFSAGGDLRQVEQLAGQGRENLRPILANLRTACERIGQLDVPVVAVIEGFAAAGGFELAQACDIVLMHESARLADIHLRAGMVPGGGSTQRLTRLVGRQRASAHILTGDALSAQQALDWGLAYRVLADDQFEQDVESFLAKLAEKDPTAISATKRLLQLAQQAPLDEGLDAEIEAALTCMVDRHQSKETTAS